jgi:hypothetical protein
VSALALTNPLKAFASKEDDLNFHDAPNVGGAAPGPGPTDPAKIRVPGSGEGVEPAIDDYPDQRRLLISRSGIARPHRDGWPAVLPPASSFAGLKPSDLNLYGF